MEVASNMTNFSEREELLERKNHSMKVSTELTLFDETWITKKRNNMEESAHNSAYTSQSKECLSKDALEEELNKTVVASRISAMKYYYPEEEQEERRLGVSTKLKLYENPFKMKKLTGSDLHNLCRLLASTSLVKDTQSEHQLIFKYCHSAKSYVFQGKWSQDFVRRRDLKKGDEIGMYWLPYY